MSNTLIIDGNSIGYANHNATKLTSGELQTQAIFGVCKSVKALAESYPGWSILVLWDGEAAWRKTIYPDYKGNRKPKDEKAIEHKEAYKRQIPYIRKALQLLGVRQLLVTSLEADDMAGVISKRLSAAGNKVVLVTGDQDWLQLINENVLWFDPIRDRKVGLSGLFEYCGYRTPEQFLDGKALMGDSSDNIGGVGGIGEKGAPEFIAQFGSVQGFFDQVDSGKFVPKKKAHINLAGKHTKEDWDALYSGGRGDEEARKKHSDAWPGMGRILYERNHKLMNLLAVPNPLSDDIQVIQSSFNKEAFRRLCEKLNFASILREFDSFVTPFENQLPKAA